MTTIVVGGVLVHDDKFLLVQEAQERCKGKWNIPAGRLDSNETIFEGAKREIFEETGCIVELTGIAEIRNKVSKDDVWMGIIFSTEIIEENIKYNKEEILDVKWFTYDEILNKKDSLRSSDWIIDAITNIKQNNVTNIDIIKITK